MWEMKTPVAPVVCVVVAGVGVSSVLLDVFVSRTNRLGILELFPTLLLLTLRCIVLVIKQPPASFYRIRNATQTTSLNENKELRQGQDF